MPVRTCDSHWYFPTYSRKNTRQLSHELLFYHFTESFTRGISGWSRSWRDIRQPTRASGAFYHGRERLRGTKCRKRTGRARGGQRPMCHVGVKNALPHSRRLVARMCKNTLVHCRGCAQRCSRIEVRGCSSLALLGRTSSRGMRFRRCAKGCSRRSARKSIPSPPPGLGGRVRLPLSRYAPKRSSTLR